jgi:hypothetical protein
VDRRREPTEVRRRLLAPRSLGWVVATGALLSASLRGSTTLVEVLVLIGVLYGVTVTFGSGRRGRTRTTSAASHPAPDPGLAAAASDVLERLDRIEHRGIELGRPWPAITVGPTGVHVVDVCPYVADPGRADALAPVGPCRRCARSARIAARIRQAIQELDPPRPVPVSALVVVATGDPSRSSAAGGQVELVPIDRLGDALARGHLLPMVTVDAVFAATTALAGARAGTGR